MKPINYININLYYKFSANSLYICSSSFEERCLHFTKEIHKQGFNFKNNLIFYNSNEFQDAINNSKNLAEIIQPNQFSLIELNTDHPNVNAELINANLKSSLSQNTIEEIIIDITTFTHETLLILIKILSFYKDKFKKIYTCYVGAKEYSKDKDESEKWLSSGISQIRSVIGYPGVISPARMNHLIILFGFETERTKLLIDNMDFEQISLGFGAEDDSITGDFQKINLDRHKALRKSYPNAKSFTFSLTNPILAKNQIKSFIGSYPEQNTVIAAMNNKISTVGTALAAIENPRVQLIYAKPIEYNSKGYSTGRDDCYIADIGNF